MGSRGSAQRLPRANVTYTMYSSSELPPSPLDARSAVNGGRVEELDRLLFQLPFSILVAC